MRSRHASRLTVIGNRDTVLQGKSISYTLKQSARIRGIRLEIHNDAGLIVVVPKRYRPEQIDEILETKSAWILRHLPVKTTLQMPLFNKEVDHGEKIRYMDRLVQVQINRDGHRKTSARLEDDKLIITCGAAAESRAGILESWYRHQAAGVFKEKADKFKTIMGLDYSRLVVRGQNKRWASASRNGNLSINWKLLMAPEAVVDYVIMHELAHFKHMDHSKNFWNFLSGFCPDWRKYRKWLLTHEDELKNAATFKR